MSKISTLYHNWRKKTFPAIISDVEWRHEELRCRLIEIDSRLKALENKKYNEKDSTSVATQHLIIDIFRLLEPKKANGFNKIRVGSPNDGGYVQLDDIKRLSMALSFGINDDDAWDVAMADMGVRVQQFDHTINQAPSTHPLLTFNKKMISGTASSESTTLAELIRAHSANDEPNIFLKIDIEGDEWETFDATELQDLEKIAQIVCEFHDLSRLDEAAFYARAKRVFTKLNASFAPIHIHANNNGALTNIANVVVHDVLEISYANRKCYSFSPTDETFPTPLDAPCNKNFPDIILGSFRF